MDPLINITLCNKWSIKIMVWMTFAKMIYITRTKGLNTKIAITITKDIKWIGLIAKHTKEITTIFKTYLKKEMLIKH